MSDCLACRGGGVGTVLSLGPQPVSNRFSADPRSPEYVHPMTLGLCPACGTVQLLDPVPAGELMPRVDWITYNEPEGHLDDMAGRIMALPGVPTGGIAGGISFKDDSTLRRLAERGFARTWRLEPEADLGISFRGAGVETVQDRLTPEAARAIAARRGKACVLVARHIVEHSMRTPLFLEALKELIEPGGYIVFEAPDCRASLEARDYTMLWEEHPLYLTESTFRALFPWAGLEVREFISYPYPFENSLVAFTRAEPAATGTPPPPGRLAEETARARIFAGRFAESREALRTYLGRRRGEGLRLAMFGASHMACVFLNIFGVAELVECVIDDNPRKRGLFMPGSRIPIVASEELTARGIGLCLLAANPCSEEAIILRNPAFTRSGGEFLSIFPGSARRLPVT